MEYNSSKKPTALAEAGYQGRMNVECNSENLLANPIQTRIIL
jgi:hypothetical protein